MLGGQLYEVAAGHMTVSPALSRVTEDGKLVKRPVLVKGNRVLVGFREDDYAALFG